MDVIKEISKIKKFKNVTGSYNESKDIWDLYIRILGNDDKTKDILNNIEELDYQYNDFGIFEIWFNPDNSKVVIEKLSSNF